MFTITDQRMGWTPMGQVEASPVYVIAFRATDDFMKGIYLIINPLSPTVWILVFVTVTVLSVTFAFQEYQRSGSMFKRGEDDEREEEGEQEGEPRTEAGLPPTRPVGRLCRARNAMRRTARQVALPILESNYFVWRSIFGAACELQAVSWGGRVTILAFGLFILFLITVYQSALTTQMVSTKVLANVENVDQGIRLGMNFCGQRVTAKQVQVLFPKIRFTNDPKDGELGHISRTDVFKGMDMGMCELAVMYEQDLEREHGLGNHCDKMKIGNPIMTSSEGIPFAPSKARALSHWLQKAVNDGTWEGIKQSIKPQSTCAVQQAAILGQVTPSDFLAQTAIVWTITLLGVLLSGLRGSRDRAVGAVTVAGSSSAAETPRHERDAKIAAAVSEELMEDRGWDEQSASRASLAAVVHGQSWLTKHRASKACSSARPSESALSDTAPAPAVVFASALLRSASVTGMQGGAEEDQRDAATERDVQEELSNMRKQVYQSMDAATSRRPDTAKPPSMPMPTENYVQRQRSKSGISREPPVHACAGTPDVESPSTRGAPIVRRNQTTKQFMDDSKKAAEGGLNI